MTTYEYRLFAADFAVQSLRNRAACSLIWCLARYSTHRTLASAPTSRIENRPWPVTSAIAGLEVATGKSSVQSRRPARPVALGRRRTRIHLHAHRRLLRRFVAALGGLVLDRVFRCINSSYLQNTCCFRFSRHGCGPGGPGSSACAGRRQSSF